MSAENSFVPRGTNESSPALFSRENKNEVFTRVKTSSDPEFIKPLITSDLAAFQGAVLVLVAELSYKGPCRKLEVELALRDQALREFWETWLAHPRIGFPTSERLAELEYLLREPGWLKRFATVDQAVRHLRQGIRGRSKPLDALELREEVLPGSIYQAPGKFEDADLSATVTALDEPCRAYLAERLAGETWDGARERLGDNRAGMNRHRRRLRKLFSRR